MKELGNYLKRTRINNGVSIEEAAKDIEVSVVELENIEKGNTRAFKDVYKMKDDIRIYAKYLGLDSEKVTEDFNDFLFEHTSKLSLDDIKKTRDNLEQQEEKNKIKSPYTIEHKPKINYRPIIIASSIILVIFIIIVLILLTYASTPTSRNSELKTNIIRKGEVL